MYMSHVEYNGPIRICTFSVRDIQYALRSDGGKIAENEGSESLSVIRTISTATAKKRSREHACSGPP